MERVLSEDAKELLASMGLVVVDWEHYSDYTKGQLIALYGKFYKVFQDFRTGSEFEIESPCGENLYLEEVEVNACVKTTEWNSPHTLPVVGSSFEINTGKRIVEVIRENFIPRREDQMEYKDVKTGKIITGRFPWRY